MKEQRIGTPAARALLAGLAVLLLAALIPQASRADGVSYTGTLDSSTSVFETTLTIVETTNVALQTYGFGGGVNQAGTTIAAGGTDPFVAIFLGTGDGASILTDALANPFGTSLVLNNFDNFTGCTPAGAPVIGGAATCGDVRLLFNGLVPGTYTVLLSDGQNIANAVFDNGTLGEGFTDLTGEAFCNLNINGVDCPNTSGAYALDILTTPTNPGTPVPEPGVLTLLIAGMGLVGKKLKK